MKRLLMMILVLALAMPCLAETTDAGQCGPAPAVEEVAPVDAEDIAPAAEEAVPAAEEVAPIEAVAPAEDAEIIAAPVEADVPEAAAELGDAPVEADVPEAAAELGDAPQMAFELFEPDGGMTWADVKDALMAGQDVTLDNNVTRGDGDGTIEIIFGECTLDLNGYTLDNGESGEPAIRVDGGGGDDTRFTITDSSTGNTGKILYRGDKNAIEITYGASVTLAGGSIAQAITDGIRGTGVYCVDNNSRFNMEGGTISACDTGVLCLDGVAFTMSGGTITGCDAGVSLSSSSAMTMTGGTITQNVRMGVNVGTNAALSVSGSPVIAGKGGWWSSGVGLAEGRAITVTGALGEGARIGVSMVSPGVCVVGSGYTLTENDLSHFSSDSPDYAVIMNADGKGELVKKPVSDASPDPVPETPAAPATPAAPTTPAPTQLSVTKKNSTRTAFLGLTYQIVPGAGTGTKFKSSNRKVATVDQNGLLTLHRAGKTRITFRVGKKKRTVTLRVKDPTVPGSIAIAPVDTNVKKGDTVALTAVLPEGTASGIRWKSSNKKVARVDANGVVTFRRRGKVTIIATAKRGKKKARVRFKVAGTK